MNRWQLLKDILLTVAGVALIGSQVFSKHPSDVIVTAGLVLTGWVGVTHSVALASSRTGGHASGSPPSSGASPSPAPPGHGEPGG